MCTCKCLLSVLIALSLNFSIQDANSFERDLHVVAPDAMPQGHVTDVEQPSQSVLLCYERILV